jgi:hypothetical protein
MTKKRDYRSEYDNYQGTETQKKNRAKRNAARKMLMDEGKVRKGDGKHVNHKVPMSKGGGNGRDNLSVKDGKDNYSYPRTRNGAMKGTRS